MTRQPSPPRRLLFNCDGHSVWVDADGDLKRWLDNTFTGLVDTHVDALLWCDGAGGNTANYTSQVLELNGQRAGTVDPHLAAALAAGQEPPRLVVEAAHERGLDVFYSFRINDCHDAFMPEELPSFKIEHPEWQLGREAAYGPHTSLNFAVPEVRDLKLRTVQELFANYDFDGIEIDLLRGPPFFTPHFEPRHAYLLTDLLRAIREHLETRAAERGRAIEVLVRVDESLGACHLDGFDVAAWVAGHLLDGLILGSGVLEIEVEAFRELVDGTGVGVYPCLYGWPSRYSPASPELIRGLAVTYWDQGADGLYLFNWFPHQAANAFQVELLSQIGDPGALAGAPAMFAAERGFEEGPDDYYPHNWLGARLPAELWPAATPLTVPVRVGAPLTGAVRVRVQLAEVDGTRVEATLGTAPLALRADGDDGWWVAAVDAGQVLHGENLLHLRLLCDGSLTPTPRVLSAEIHGVIDAAGTTGDL